MNNITIIEYLLAVFDKNHCTMQSDESLYNLLYFQYTGLLEHTILHDYIARKKFLEKIYELEKSKKEEKETAPKYNFKSIIIEHIREKLKGLNYIIITDKWAYLWNLIEKYEYKIPFKRDRSGILLNVEDIKAFLNHIEANGNSNDRLDSIV